QRAAHRRTGGRSRGVAPDLARLRLVRLFRRARPAEPAGHRGRDRRAGDLMTGITVRNEGRDSERRAPVVPAGAARLVRHGISVTVEESPQRVFPIADYAAAGCAIAPAGSWVDAPAGEYVVGLKELPERPEVLRHRHIYFGHAYKGQHGAAGLLSRF